MNRVDGVASEAAILVGVLLPDHPLHEDPLDELAGLDSVAYVRFASVYKNFREAKDFEDFIGAEQLANEEAD